MRRTTALLALSLFLPLGFSEIAGKVAAAQAPEATGSVSGAVTDASGTPVPHAVVVLKTAAGEGVATAESDAAGKFALTHLRPGEYDLTVSGAGFAEKKVHVIVTGTPGLLDVALSPQSQPPANPSAPSLSDLGFSSQQTQADPKLQALLQKRTEMLRMHQRLGLITTIPMVATLFTGGEAKVEREGEGTATPNTRKVNDTNLNLHTALGAVTGAMYGMTASYAIRAPRVPGSHKHGAIRFHEALAWVHGPGMLATGVLGIMAYKQESSGEHVHGIASAHGPVAVITTLAYGTSMIAVSWPIHVKFWEKKQ
ncbi:carboxypeptidase regulatory-like domain-containing protein [Acidobacteria bacterium AB60]|nr:carboxypeptidase regulatory-like domain-containing protein [Acidobacteria bacterium AB60]